MLDGGAASRERDWTDELGLDPRAIGGITGLGEDARGKLYLVSQRGRVFRLAPDGECARERDALRWYGRPLRDVESMNKAG